MLFVVSTPIGNLEDISLRALRVLKEVDIIACEDTRVTGKLLAFYNIQKTLISYHAHSGLLKEKQLFQLLQNGKSLALVSDAGTPGISDPGGMFIKKALALGIRVVPIPGASAFLAALQGAGVDTSSFLYLGFLPQKHGRGKIIASLLQEKRTVIFYESPNRLLKTLKSLRESSKHITVARELTKIHEEFVQGNPEEVYRIFSQRPSIKGECVVILV